MCMGGSTIRSPSHPSDSSGAAATRVLGQLVVLLLLAYVAWTVVPPLWAGFQFRQAMRNETLYGPANEAPSRIRSRLLAEAERRGLNVEPQQIRVDKQGPRVHVEAALTIPVDFGAGLVWHWRDEPSYEGTRRPPARQRR